MIYVESPIRFFDKIEDLIKIMWQYAEEHEGEQQGLFFFKTPAFLNLESGEETFIRTLCISKKEESEVEERSLDELLHCFHMCQFSLDNKNYCDPTQIENNKLMLDIFSAETKENKYQLYIRDITGTFYTIITPENKGYFEYIYRKKV